LPGPSSSTATLRSSNAVPEGRHDETEQLLERLLADEQPGELEELVDLVFLALRLSPGAVHRCDHARNEQHHDDM
jgi:hypothetical protein